MSKLSKVILIEIIYTDSDLRYKQESSEKNLIMKVIHLSKKKERHGESNKTSYIKQRSWQKRYIKCRQAFLLVETY